MFFFKFNINIYSLNSEFTYKVVTDSIVSLGIDYNKLNSGERSSSFSCIINLTFFR